MQLSLLLYYIYHDTLDHSLLKRTEEIVRCFKVVVNEMDRTWLWVQQLQDNINKLECRRSDTISEEILEQFRREVHEFERGLRMNKSIASNGKPILDKVSSLNNGIDDPQVLRQLNILEESLKAYYRADSRNSLDEAKIQFDVRLIIKSLREMTKENRSAYSEMFVKLTEIAKDLSSYGVLPELKKADMLEKEQQKIEYLLDRWKFSEGNKDLHEALTAFYRRANDNEDLKDLVSAVTEATFVTYNPESSDDERLSALESLNELTPRSLSQTIVDVLKVIFMTLLAAALAIAYLTYFSIPLVLSATIIAQSAAAGAVLGGIIAYFGIFAFNPEKARRDAVEISNIIQNGVSEDSSNSLRDARDDYVGEYPDGIADIINDCKHVNNKEYKKLILNPTMGCIMTGPPGCGKTMLAEIISLEVGCPFIKVSMNDILSHMIYEPVANIHKVYADALEQAQKHPSKIAVLFFDEVENVLPKRGGRNNLSEHTNAMTGALLELIQDQSSDGARVIVVGATNRPDFIDPAATDRLKLINIPFPTEEKRAQILKTHLEKMSCDLTDPDVIDGINCVASMTHDCSARTLVDLIKEAGRMAYNEHSDQIEGSHLMRVAVNFQEKIASHAFA